MQKSKQWQKKVDKYTFRHRVTDSKAHTESARASADARVHGSQSVIQSVSQ